MEPQMSSDLNTLNQSRGDLLKLQGEVADLQRRLEKQAILLRALFVFLRDVEGLTEQQLLDRFHQCEAQRSKAPPAQCWNCGRMVNSRHNRCLYCNEPCRVQSAFELLDAGVWPDRQDDKEHHIVAGPPAQEGITILED
jgi:hypothetical protein